jgi:4-amino-4-deoxy-L-arabinose transferase-like glycosyltransferase
VNMSIVTPAGQPTRQASTPAPPPTGAGRRALASPSAAPLPGTGRRARSVPPASGSGRLPVPVWVIAAAFVAVELAVSGRYGFLQDELYFIEAGRHLAFGYVDQPPLAPLLTRVTDVLGVSPTAIRIVPALAGGAVVVIAARFAVLFGAGRFGRILAALITACAPLVLALSHLGITEGPDLLAWALVLLCVTTALLRDRPHWWLGAGLAAGIGLEDNNLMLLLLIGLAAGILCSGHRWVLGTRWPWLGAGIAAVIWAPNVAWQAAHGWPQLAMASELHQLNSSPAARLAGPATVLAFAGVLVIPLLVAGFVRLWRTPDLRFLAITSALLVVYVLAWIPGKTYYAEGTAPALVASAATAAEGWIARGPRPGLRRRLVVAAPLVSIAISAQTILPIVPIAYLHDVPNLDKVTTADTFGWPQLTRVVAAQSAALARAGQAPTSIFAGNYGEAGALDVLGTADHLPPVLSGNNNYWIWGPGRASDSIVLVVDALGWLRPYFAHCHVLTTYYAPYHVPSDFTGLDIGICTGPVGGWRALWPHLQNYG